MLVCEKGKKTRWKVGTRACRAGNADEVCRTSFSGTMRIATHHRALLFCQYANNRQTSGKRWQDRQTGTTDSKTDKKVDIQTDRQINRKKDRKKDS